MAEPYGLLARMPDPATLKFAARQLRDEGWTRVQAYSPYPVEGMDEVLGYRMRWSGPVTLVLALLAAAAAFGMQWYSAVVDYPFVVGGKPFGYWAPFVLVTFAMGLLGTVAAALGCMILGNRLPQPYHPAFNAAGFVDASGDGLFLLIEAADPKFDARNAHDALLRVGASEVSEVPA
ncbi:DUF3341 domain-containing protein [uncultured Abyssibacter sp.]|uniref:DUF3341 domain-containing protein n=1 Tax=uncultured Abyssibacter sp. TaxID=2320202 RepID=UPI0032B26D03